MDSFARGVFTKKSTDELFNQYNDKDVDLKYDKPDGASIRRDDLLNYLKSIRNWDSIDMIVGEAEGKNGMRFSGVPFASEMQLLSGKLPFKGEQSSLGELHGKRKSKPYYAC